MKWTNLDGRKLQFCQRFQLFFFSLGTDKLIFTTRKKTLIVFFFFVRLFDRQEWQIDDYKTMRNALPNSQSFSRNS